jgi:hypothetical protein
VHYFCVFFTQHRLYCQLPAMCWLMVYFFFTYSVRFILLDANIDGGSGNFLANINFASLLIVLISGVSLISFSVFRYMYIHTKTKKKQHKSIFSGYPIQPHHIVRMWLTTSAFFAWRAESTEHITIKSQTRLVDFGVRHSNQFIWVHLQDLQKRN